MIYCSRTLKNIILKISLSSVFAWVWARIRIKASRVRVTGVRTEILNGGNVIVSSVFVSVVIFVSVVRLC